MTLNKADFNLISYSSCHINPGHQSEHQSERHERLRRQRQLLRPGASLGELPRPCFCSSLVFEAPLSYLGSKGCCPSKENKINIRMALRNKAKGCLTFLHLFASDGSEAGRFKGRRELPVACSMGDWPGDERLLHCLAEAIGELLAPILIFKFFSRCWSDSETNPVLVLPFFFFPLCFAGQRESVDESGR